MISGILKCVGYGYQASECLLKLKASKEEIEQLKNQENPIQWNDLFQCGLHITNTFLSVLSLEKSFEEEMTSWKLDRAVSTLNLDEINELTKPEINELIKQNESYFQKIKNTITRRSESTETHDAQISCSHEELEALYAQIQALIGSAKKSSETFQNLENYIELSNTHRDIVRTQQNINLGLLACDLFQETKNERPFSGAILNITLFNKGIRAYLQKFPDSKLSELFQGKASEGHVLGAATITGSAFAKLMQSYYNRGAAVAHLDEEELPDAIPEEDEFNIAFREEDLPNEIPVEFEDDSILSNHLCPIAQFPIRFPVYYKFREDEPPRQIDYFERDTLYGWLAMCSAKGRPFTHPCTNEVIDEDLIFQDIELQEQIEVRLRTLLNPELDID